jgi:CRP-like cAMP-binding protein
MLLTAACPAHVAGELEDTRREPSFSICPPKGLHGHLNRIRDQGMRLRYRRNEMIVSERDDAQHIYSVVGGCIRLCRHAPDGRRHIPDFMFPGDIFGVGDFRHYPYSAEAVNTVSVIAFPRAAFERLVDVDVALRTDMMVHFSAMLARAHQHLFMANCQNARERLASFIIQISERDHLVYGDRIDVPMGRQEIADHLGLTIETICRVLASFRETGIVEVPNAHQFVVKRPDELRALAEGRAAH